MGKGFGLGKTIFFGDYFVIWGFPTIASSLIERTLVEVERSESYEIIDNRPETPGYKSAKYHQLINSVSRIFNAMGINDKKNSVTITLFGDLKATSGVGASAASCAAIARALNDEFKMNHKDEEINSFTFEGEKAYHGAPSGIDNTCAVFGGLIVFERNLKGGENKVERLALKAPVECVLGNTGITSDTSEAVADVTREKETDQKRFARIFHHYEGIVAEGKKAFQEDDLKKVGEMMNENHDLLRQIGVSCKESELLVEIARASGALGAKITGTGRGGLVLALTPGKKLQEEVARSIEEKHFEAMRIRIGKNLLA